MSDSAHDLRPLSIKRGSHDIVVDPPVMAAPMSGVIDHPYRRILHEMGCPFTFTEMISSRALCEGSIRTEEIIGDPRLTGREGGQLFGSDPEYLGKGAELLWKRGFALLDLNAGCPKRKVMAQGSGGALLRDSDVLMSCLGALLDGAPLPVGVKLRSGLKEHRRGEFRGLLLDIEGAGASYVSIHGRTVSQGFSGRADREVVRRAAGAIDIPVLASGDVRSPDDVLDYSGRGARGVLVGRALMGSPEWFARFGRYNEHGSWSDVYPSTDGEIRERFDVMRSHLGLLIDHTGEERGIKAFRPHLAWYIAKFRGRSGIIDRVYRVGSRSEITDLMMEIETRWIELAGSRRTGLRETL